MWEASHITWAITRSETIDNLTINSVNIEAGTSQFPVDFLFAYPLHRNVVWLRTWHFQIKLLVSVSHKEWKLHGDKSILQLYQDASRETAKTNFHSFRIHLLWLLISWQTAVLKNSTRRWEITTVQIRLIKQLARERKIHMALSQTVALSI